MLPQRSASQGLRKAGLWLCLLSLWIQLEKHALHPLFILLVITSWNTQFPFKVCIPYTILSPYSIPLIKYYVVSVLVTEYDLILSFSLCFYHSFLVKSAVMVFLDISLCLLYSSYIYIEFFPPYKMW